MIQSTQFPTIRPGSSLLAYVSLATCDSLLQALVIPPCLCQASGPPHPPAAALNRPTRPSRPWLQSASTRISYSPAPSAASHPSATLPLQPPLTYPASPPQKCDAHHGTMPPPCPPCPPPIFPSLLHRRPAPQALLRAHPRSRPKHAYPFRPPTPQYRSDLFLVLLVPPFFLTHLCKQRSQQKHVRWWVAQHAACG